MSEATVIHPIPDALNGELQAFDPMRRAIVEAMAETPTFDYEAKDGNKAARSHVHSLRLLKGKVDAVRKAEKAEYLRLGRVVDSEAKPLIEAVETLIAPHAGAIQAIEQREADRVRGIRETIEAMQALSRPEPTASPDELRAALTNLRGFNGPFDEFAEDAERIRDAGIATLESAIEAAVQREAEAAELARLRAEAEARAEADRKAEAERQRIEREAAIAKQAEERARQEAADREEAQRRRAEEAEQRAREAAEAAERAAKAAADAEERRAAEAAERERRDREEAEKRAQAERDQQQAAQARKRELTMRRAAMIADAAESIMQAADLGKVQAMRVAEAIFDGRIAHVGVTA